MNEMQTRRMRAAIVVGAGAVEVREVPVPRPGPGQVLVQLEGCGVCASNLGPWAGPEWMEFPTEPGGLGHEGWGRIAALGEGVTGLEPGDRVAALSYHAYAGHDMADASEERRLAGAAPASSSSSSACSRRPSRERPAMESGLMSEPLLLPLLPPSASPSSSSSSSWPPW